MIESLFSRATVLAAAFAGLGMLIAATAPAQGSPAADNSAQAKNAGGDPSIVLSPADEQGRYRYMIVFDEPALLDLGAAVKSGNRLDTRAPEFERAMSEIRQFQAARVDSINAAVARSVEVSHHFVVTRNGIGARLTPAEAQQVEQLPAVKSVERERVYSLDTFRSSEFIGADSVWDGTNTPDGTGLRGRGMIAGILDSGTNLDHPSFANDPSCGHGEPGTPDKLISAVDCSETDVGGFCDGPDPNDTNGHGSHTASTVVGNLLDNAATPSPGIPAPHTEMAGVAPCAHIRSYKVCPGQSCPGLDLQAGFATLLLDGDVDVMNYSISGGTDPWNDGDSVKLDIVEAGTFVAASAGNTSDNQPDPVGQVNHRGPWVMSVAASTRDGDFFGVGSISGPGTPPAATQDVSMDRGSDSPLGESFTDKAIRRDTNQPDGADGCSPGGGGPAFPQDFFVDSVALIQRGNCTFTEKINNAADAGADMVVIWNNAAGGFGMSTPDQAAVPAYSISQNAGQAMANFIDSNPADATFDFELEAIPGDVLANFSFRGPTPAPLQNLQKPNITAPGVDIFAARADGEEFGLLSGTSMSGPHVAGAAVLARQAHPDWTPMEVKSALQMTAKKSGLKDDGTTPWDWDDVGSGRVELTRALLAGLVMDETIQNFRDANPDISGGDVRTLNLPSVRDVACDPDCTWTRTVRAGQDFATSWTVSTQSSGFDVDVTPNSFELAERDVLFRDGGETGDTQPNSSVQAIEITVDNVSSGDIRFGEIDFTEGGPLTPGAHITIAVENPTVR